MILDYSPRPISARLFFTVTKEIQMQKKREEKLITPSLFVGVRHISNDEPYDIYVSSGSACRYKEPNRPNRNLHL
jgi:hypothetical protein